MELNLFKILICDDSLLIRKQFKDLLISHGCSQVFEATDGQDAVDKYKTYNPNLVFMDIVMPVKTGIEAVSEILEYDKNAKIVMASSSGTKTHLRKSIEAGASDFIQKPIDESQILNIINNLKKEA
jgi:two-component system, chemotaxis family, chemotaxis protein CheY